MSTHTAKKKEEKQKKTMAKLVRFPLPLPCFLSSLLSAKLGIISKQLPEAAASYMHTLYIYDIMPYIFAYG